jgi:hypothetical protein
VGTDGNPMADVSEFAKVLDYVGEKFLNICIIILLKGVPDRGHEL